jgi:hypothetical protein
MKTQHDEIRKAFEKYNSPGVTHKDDIDFGALFYRGYSRDASFYHAGYIQGQKSKDAILRKILKPAKDPNISAGAACELIITLIEKELKA